MVDKKAIIVGGILVAGGVACWLASMPYTTHLKELRSQDMNYALKDDIGHNDIAEIDAGGAASKWQVAGSVIGGVGVVVTLSGALRKKH